MLFVNPVIISSFNLLSMLRILLLLLINTQIAVAQLTFQKNFGGEKFDRGMFLNHTKDGGYFVCGYSRSYGNKEDIYIARLDKKGNVNWQKHYGTEGLDMAWGGLETSDGSLLIHGTWWKDSINDDVTLLKLDKAGNLLWQKFYGNEQKERVTQMITLDDGNFLLIGQRTVGKNNIDSYVVKISDDGNIIWEKTFGSSYSERTFYAAETTSGNYLLCGIADPHLNDKADIYLLTLNKDGKELWSRNIGEKNIHEIAHSIGRNSDKKTFTITGYTGDNSNSIQDALFMQVDENGNVLTQKKYRTGEDIRLMHAEETTDKGFIVTGYTRKDITKNICDAVLLKYNSKGEPEWLKTFGLPDKDDQGYWIVPDKDGGYSLTGYTLSYGIEGDVWLIKTDKKGNLKN
jgi:hypothetical protein